MIHPSPSEMRRPSEIRMDVVNERGSRLNRVALVGNYLPRRCGIATFTADLTEALAAATPSVDWWVVAMNDSPNGYPYPGGRRNAEDLLGRRGQRHVCGGGED